MSCCTCFTVGCISKCQCSCHEGTLGLPRTPALATEDHTADAEALASVQAFVADLDAGHRLQRLRSDLVAYSLHFELTLADLRRVVAMADQIGDAR